MNLTTARISHNFKAHLIFLLLGLSLQSLIVENALELVSFSLRLNGLVVFARVDLLSTSLLKHLYGLFVLLFLLEFLCSPLSVGSFAFVLRTDCVLLGLVVLKMG